VAPRKCCTQLLRLQSEGNGSLLFSAASHLEASHLGGATMPLTLVTGAPGWLGTRLVRVLLEGLPDVPSLSEPDRARRIRCLVAPELDKSALRGLPAGVETGEGDLRDPKALSAFARNAEGAILFHCAGVVHPRGRTSDFFSINVDGTRNLLEAAENAHVRRAVIVSSNSPFGFNTNRDDSFDEQSPYNPYMGYGRSKMLMEELVHTYQARGKMETVIVRPTWFYGPDQPPRQTRFFRMIRRGRAPIVGSGENRRSMAYVDSVCQALLLCESTPAANGQTYWIADRRAYTMNEITDTVERLMEQEFGLTVAHKRMRLPAVASDAARLGDKLIQSLGLYHQEIHVLSEMGKSIVCSITKAERELGYEPIVELEEGMRRSLAWCLREGLSL
jgi:nucleoside-diphosphate-sugar epimerase